MIMDNLERARYVFDAEIMALERTRDSLGEDFCRILDAVTHCSGKVVITGMGKPGHIAKKLAATFSSLGTSSFYLHPGEAMHGDLGMISEEDIVIAISYSGESDEIIRILPNIKMIGAMLVGITGNRDSTLAQAADILQVLPKFKEACSLGLAPTSSTTAVLCYGDALAVVASEIYGFGEVDFGRFHPAGSLGKKLILKVEDLMVSGEKNASVRIGTSLKDAIIELSKKGLGVVSITDEEGCLLGVITDGDLRRLLEKGADLYEMFVEDVMSRNLKTIQKEKMAVDALNMMKTNNISCLIVTEGKKSIGTIRLQNVIGVGIV